jgi:hypothetical protein
MVIDLGCLCDRFALSPRWSSTDVPFDGGRRFRRTEVCDDEFVNQVIATSQDGVRHAHEQFVDGGVEPGERVVIEIRRCTERDFERDDAGCVYESVEAFVGSLEDYCELPGRGRWRR